MTKEVNQLPQSKRKRSSQKNSEESESDQSVEQPPTEDQPVEQSQSDSADQPVEQSQSDESAEESKEELAPYQPKHRPLQNAGVDQHTAEEEREAARRAQREEHNRRVGDASR
jgi:hypothetical protein